MASVMRQERRREVTTGVRHLTPPEPPGGGNRLTLLVGRYFALLTQFLGGLMKFPDTQANESVDRLL